MTQADKLEALVRKARQQPDWKWYPQEESVNDILFNHDFARALFPSDKKWVVTSTTHTERTMYAHSKLMSDADHHSQQAIISDDPIDYFYQAIFS